MRTCCGLQPRYRPRYDCGDTQPAALGPQPPPAPHLVTILTMPALALLALAVAGAAAAAAVGEFVVSPLCPRPQLAIAKYGRVPPPV